MVIHKNWSLRINLQILSIELISELVPPLFNNGLKMMLLRYLFLPPSCISAINAKIDSDNPEFGDSYLLPSLNALSTKEK